MLSIVNSARTAALRAAVRRFSTSPRSKRPDAASGVHQDEPYVPRRAFMYVPGNDAKKIAKIASLRADCFVLDCEDGVALNRKEEARRTIHRLLNGDEFAAVRRSVESSECCVRLNGVDSGLFQTDAGVVLGGPTLPRALALPKVERPAHLDVLAETLHRLLPSGTRVRLVAFIESARSLLDMDDICRHAALLSDQGAAFRLDAVVFGSDDFCADIGATRTADATELLYARQRLVAVAKAWRLQAVDLVHTDIGDAAGLQRQSAEGSRMGFTGKQVIHPAQIATVQAAFTPSREHVDWARQLVDAFERHQATGAGAFTFRGHMVDRPLLLQAHNVLRVAGRTESTEPPPS